MTKSSSLITTEQQLDLNLRIALEREVNGIGMGVFSDGTPFLNVRGLARLCGVDHSTVIRITQDWLDVPLKPREQKIRELVRDQGADDSIAFRAIDKGGTIHHTVSVAVCMSVLEYYAFEARADNDTASKNYRVLARKGLTEFIYSQVGYNPTGQSNVAWQQFHDRVSLSYHTVPDGYFSIFKEVADFFVTLIRQGADLGKSFIPDLSIGSHWSKFWVGENLEIIFGERIKYQHNYPEYFPQSASNPQMAYCYPDDALGEFRKWIREIYIVNKLPTYLSDKVKQGYIAAPRATAALAAFKPSLTLK